MKSLHRIKALETYNGARIMLKQGLVYPSYMLLKEATRSTLAYINEDIQDKNYSEKTKLRTLIDESPAQLSQDIDLSVFDVFVDMDREGLAAILALDIETLKRVKSVLKRLIGMYLNEHV